MTNLKALGVVAEALRGRGLDVVEEEVAPGSVGLFVGEQLVCRTVPEGIQIQHVLVCDGLTHVVPEGCDATIVKAPPAGRPWATDHVLAEVLRRMGVRATSRPRQRPGTTLRERLPATIAPSAALSLCGDLVSAAHDLARKDPRWLTVEIVSQTALTALRRLMLRRPAARRMVLGVARGTAGAARTLAHEAPEAAAYYRALALVLFAAARHEPPVADLHAIAGAVSKRLGRQGVVGSFSVTPGPAADRLEWTGARCHRRDAEDALMAALREADLGGERALGMGVIVAHVGIDHEATVHNAEPPEALVVECESDAAFVERYEGSSIDTAAE